MGTDDVARYFIAFDSIGSRLFHLLLHRGRYRVYLVIGAFYLVFVAGYFKGHDRTLQLCGIVDIMLAMPRLALAIAIVDFRAKHSSTLRSPISIVSLAAFMCVWTRAATMSEMSSILRDIVLV